MKTEKNILIAFLLNFIFAIAECVGGLLTGSVAILSDSVHDLGDAISIGISWFLEKTSRRKADEKYTYGYGRYSVLGSVITTVVLLVGSVLVIYGSIQRLVHPTPIDYNGMIIFGIFGVIVNTAAALFTKDGDSLNQKAVNLHMLEDVLGWVVVLIGAVIMRFTDLSVIDPLMSMAVSAFILVHAVKNLKESVVIFLEKTPEGTGTEEIKHHVEEIEGVENVHHIHIWSMDGASHCATMHVVTDAQPSVIKPLIREELREHGIGHVTIEIEGTNETCDHEDCCIETEAPQGHSHHHHH